MIESFFLFEANTLPLHMFLEWYTKKYTCGPHYLKVTSTVYNEPISVNVIACYLNISQYLSKLFILFHFQSLWQPENGSVWGCERTTPDNTSAPGGRCTGNSSTNYITSTGIILFILMQKLRFEEQNILFIQYVINDSRKLYNSHICLKEFSLHDT